MIRKLCILTLVLGILFALAMLMTNCSSNNKGDDDSSTGDDDTTNNLDISICDPSKSGFTVDITNPFFPLAPNEKWVLQGQEGGAMIRVEITGLDQTQVIAGVTTRIREEREFSDDVLFEISHNYFVQTADGTVCYYGENVDEYDADGNITGHSGTWIAGESNNKPGIQMPAHPAVGMSYDMEFAPGVAQDHGEVSSMGDSITVPFGTFTDTLTVIETSALESGQSPKQYAKGIGILSDEVYLLISHE